MVRMTFSGYGAALPFDENYRPKPAVAAIIEGFTESPFENAYS
jgi:GH35 family endo-1,4-beta-xylanase